MDDNPLDHCGHFPIEPGLTLEYLRRLVQAAYVPPVAFLEQN